MSKIIRKLGTPEENEEPNKKTVSINKTIVNQDSSLDQIDNTVEKSVITKLDSNKIIEKPQLTKADEQVSEDNITNWFIDFFGEDIFSRLKSNPNIKIPYLPEGISLNQWILEAFKTIFTLDDLKIIQNKINLNYIDLKQRISKIDPELHRLEEQIEQLNLEKKKLAEENDEIFSKKYKLEQKTKTLVSLDDFINSIFDTEGKENVIHTLLKESLESPSDELVNFITGFAKGWHKINHTIAKLTQDDLENIERFDKCLREMLLFISGYYIPQRRALLDAIANYINEYLSEFIFISPEETLLVEPKIHNAKGLGGSKIKEGISFAVLRKQNRQTFKYADIKVY